MKYKAFIVLIGLLGLSTQLQAKLLKGKPDAIVCTVTQSAVADEWDQFVFYVSGVRSDGTVMYKSLFSNPALISIDSEGKITAPNLSDCNGKHIDELYKEGRAAHFGN